MTSLVDPSGAHGLKDTEDEHEVGVEVVVHNIEEGEAPVEGEEDGADHAEENEEESDELARHSLERRRVLHDSGASLEHGEGRVDSEGEEGDRKDEEEGLSEFFHDQSTCTRATRKPVALLS